MHYIISEQTEEPNPTDQLCEELRHQIQKGRGGSLKNFRHVIDDSGNIFGTGRSKIEGGHADVYLKILFVPSRDLEDGEDWVAVLTKEDGQWKLCGFRRA